MALTLQAILLSAVSVAGGVAGLVLAAYINRYRGKAGAGWFVAALGVQASWCGSYGISLLVSDRSLRYLFEAISFTAMTALGVVFLGFALIYTGRSGLIESWWYPALLGFAALTGVLSVTNPWHHLVWSEFRIEPVYGAVTVRYAFEPWGILALIVAILTVGVAVILLVDTVLSYGPLYRWEATAVALSTLPPASALLVWAFGIGPVPELNLAPAMFILHAGFDAYAFVGQDMFETNPTTMRAAERNAMDDLDSPVVVLDTDDTVVRFNDAAGEILGLDEGAPGRPMEAVLERDTETLDRESVVSLPMASGRMFATSVSTLTDPRGELVGRTVVFQDVTEDRRRQERLEVLNRVLRHNLRNEMTVVDGFAERIEQTTEEDRITEWARTVREAGTDLLGIGETVRDFERAGGDDPQPRPVPVVDVLTEVASEMRAEYPDATIEVDLDLPTGSRTETDPDILKVVVSNLIENSIEHGTRQDTPVTLAADLDTGTLIITVTDSGPGIPESELGPVRTGTESDLEHGSGIGLWVVRWGVDALNGTVSFDVDGDGTTVRIRLGEVWVE